MGPVSAPRTHPCRSPTRGDQPTLGSKDQAEEEQSVEESCPAPIGMKATAPPRHGPPALTQSLFFTQLSRPAFSLPPLLEALRLPQPSGAIPWTVGTVLPTSSHNPASLLLLVPAPQCRRALQPSSSERGLGTLPLPP